MIFERGGGWLAKNLPNGLKVSGGVKELGVGELGVSGDGRARCPYRAGTLNSKLTTNRRAKPFIRRGTLHGVWRSRVILPKDRGNVN